MVCECKTLYGKCLDHKPGKEPHPTQDMEEHDQLVDVEFHLVNHLPYELTARMQAANFCRDALRFVLLNEVPGVRERHCAVAWEELLKARAMPLLEGEVSLTPDNQ